MEEENSLHALWDSCILLDYYEFKRPLTTNGKKHIQKLAQELTLRFPEEVYTISKNLDVNHWLEESYQIAINFVYHDIEPQTIPSKEYLHVSQKIACQQLAIAGYRLATLLNQIFENYK